MEPINSNHARHRARISAMQSLYQWQMTQDSPAVIRDQFIAEQDFSRTDVAYFEELLLTIPTLLAELDAILLRYTDRGIEEVDPIERAVLRLATYELVHHIELPYPVVISEAVGLSKNFGANEAYKYVNGILDKVAGEVRKLEVEAAHAVKKDGTA